MDKRGKEDWKLQRDKARGWEWCLTPRGTEAGRDREQVWKPCVQSYHWYTDFCDLTSILSFPSIVRQYGSDFVLNSNDREVNNVQIFLSRITQTYQQRVKKHIDSIQRWDILTRLEKRKRPGKDFKKSNLELSPIEYFGFIRKKWRKRVFQAMYGVGASRTKVGNKEGTL